MMKYNTIYDRLINHYMIVFVVFLGLCSVNAYAVCTIGVNSCTNDITIGAETVLTQTAKTEAKILTKQQEVIASLEEYKVALEKKKQRLIAMLKTLRGIESLMKKNYVQRQNVVKLWGDTVNLQSIPIKN